jgi:hypothetical protein
MQNVTETNSIGDVEAATRLGLPYSAFIGYIQRGLICYSMIGRERYYNPKELARFKTEVLERR